MYDSCANGKENLKKWSSLSSWCYEVKTKSDRLLLLAPACVCVCFNSEHLVRSLTFLNIIPCTTAKLEANRQKTTQLQFKPYAAGTSIVWCGTLFLHKVIYVFLLIWFEHEMCATACLYMFVSDRQLWITGKWNSMVMCGLKMPTILFSSDLFVVSVVVALFLF